tara:strand:+ start:56 stop:1039 length:984 start_codon:yes stop_codon:yes gene_type:complete
MNPNLLAEVQFNIGYSLIHRNKFVEAEEFLRKAIDIKPDYAEAYNDLADVLGQLGKIEESEICLRKSHELKPDLTVAIWNLYGLSKTIEEAESWILKCLDNDENFLKAKITLSALRLHQGDPLLFNELLQSEHKNHPAVRSIKWVSTLPNHPELFFNRWDFFDRMIDKCERSRPFYEFGVWRGVSFKYLKKYFAKGYGFDTFTGLVEDWYVKKGTYDTDGISPSIDGGTFIKGEYSETLPSFFSEPRPKASLINFDCDTYSSTLCALNNSKSVIDSNTILIFDEFIVNEEWEQDEYKALNEFCFNNNLKYEVIAVSYYTLQVAVRLI